MTCTVDLGNALPCPLCSLPDRHKLVTEKRCHIILIGMWLRHISIHCAKEQLRASSSQKLYLAELRIYTELETTSNSPYCSWSACILSGTPVDRPWLSCDLWRPSQRTPYQWVQPCLLIFGLASATPETEARWQCR